MLTFHTASLFHTFFYLEREENLHSRSPLALGIFLLAPSLFLMDGISTLLGTLSWLDPVENFDSSSLLDLRSFFFSSSLLPWLLKVGIFTLRGISSSFERAEHFDSRSLFDLGSFVFVLPLRPWLLMVGTWLTLEASRAGKSDLLLLMGILLAELLPIGDPMGIRLGELLLIGESRVFPKDRVLRCWLGLLIKGMILKTLLIVYQILWWFEPWRCSEFEIMTWYQQQNQRGYSYSVRDRRIGLRWRKPSTIVSMTWLLTTDNWQQPSRKASQDSVHKIYKRWPKLVAQGELFAFWVAYCFTVGKCRNTTNTQNYCNHAESTQRSIQFLSRYSTLYNSLYRNDSFGD